jgi:hypothetical protein
MRLREIISGLPPTVPNPVEPHAGEAPPDAIAGEESQDDSPVIAGEDDSSAEEPTL